MSRTLFSMIAGASVALIAITAPMEASAQSRTRSQTIPTQTEIDDDVRMMIARDDIACDYDTARFIGRNSEDRTLYEVACRGNPGFLLLDTDPAQQVNCIANNASVAARRAEDPEAEVGAECTFESNTNVIAQVTPYVQTAGLACEVDGARWVGAVTNSNATRYEVGCGASDGFWFDVTPAGEVSNVMSCLQVAAAGGTCQFSPAAEQAAWVAAIAAPSGRTCAATTARFVGANATTGQRYYEVGCADGVGFMVRTNSVNAFESVIECSAAGGIAGGCTLSDGAAVAVASAEELQARLASAGIACDYVDNRSPRQELDGDRRTVVEFSCSDRPWGLVAFLPNASGSPEEIDCLTAQARIGGCSLTTKGMLIDNLNLLTPDRPSLSSCSVADFRMAGRLTAEQAGGQNLAGDVVELLCEGGAGFVTVLRPDRAGFVQSQTCATSEERGGTRCELGA
jgi:hypothetical protein